jgi:signal transduction histidine kinase/DNA-binding NarL/FixJ family response regulator
MNSYIFLNSATAWNYRDWLPPVEGAVDFMMLISFAIFVSKLLNLPADQKKLLKFANYYLLITLAFSSISLIKGWSWYNQNIVRYIVGSVTLYLATIFYILGRWILKAKLYKERVVKIIIIGTGILIIYLLADKLMQLFHVFNFFQRNNLVVTGVLYIFAYALVVKFNREYEELIILKNSLEQKILERTAELSKAKKEIEDAKERIEIISSERTDFFINLAHETKTPLTIISNYLERYIKKHGLNEEIEIVKKNIDMLCKDMVDFMDLEKLIKGTFSYENNQITDFSKLLNDRICLFKEYVNEKNIGFSFDIACGLFVKADPKLIDRIIYNLLENAVKYTPTGGKINILLSGKNNEIIFKVSDTGVGISETKLTHIFEPYYQISHKKLNIQGMGMGLYVVKRSIELINGSIIVESDENKGSTFLVKLPLCIAAENEKIISFSPSISAVPTGNIIEKEIDPEKNSILIVEDNIDMLNYLIEELTTDYNIHPAKNGLDAIKKMMTISIPDLIISDIMMDQMDGEEFFNKISSNSNYRNIPFIFLTAKSQQDEKIKMLQSGAIDYISKPFSISELKARIKTIIENSEKQKKEGLKQAIDVITKKITDPEKSAPAQQQIFEEKCKQYVLTERQKEIAVLIAEGLEYKEIADKLSISHRTVTNHVENLFDKLDIHNKVDLINLLFR